MNTNLLTTVVLRQHLQRAYAEMGEDLWPILQRIIKDLMETNIPEDRQRHDYEVREW